MMIGSYRITTTATTNNSTVFLLLLLALNFSFLVVFVEGFETFSHFHHFDNLSRNNNYRPCRNAKPSSPCKTSSQLFVRSQSTSSTTQNGSSINGSNSRDRSSNRSQQQQQQQKNAFNDRRRQSLEHGNHPLVSLNYNLDALAQSGNAAPRAQELLQRIHALYQEGYYEVSPNIVSYNSVLKAWKEENNPEKAYELLQEMIQNKQMQNDYDYNNNYYGTTNSGNGIEVDVISFNTVILAFAKKGNYPQAEDLLRQMQLKKEYPNPDAFTYNAVLYAFAQSRDEGTAIEAENLLKEMMGNPQCNVTVDTMTFNTVLHAWSQTADASTPTAANRAQQLLEHMERLSAAGNINVTPDVYSYSTVIQAWSKCGDPVKAQQILDRMTTLRGLVPNRVTYTSVMTGLAKSGRAAKAEMILNEMMEAYEYGGNEELKPDTVAFSCVIDGWAKLSSVDKPHASEHALRLLDQMKRMEHEGMGPNARTYTSVLTALAKSGTWDACDRARELLEEMEKEYEKSGNVHMRPTTIHYNTVLLAYGRSPRADKGIMAGRFVAEMRKHPSARCRPDTISYNTLLMACANAFGDRELKQKSFAVALEAFKAICTGGGGTTAAASGSTSSSSSNRGGSSTNTVSTIIQPTSTTFNHFCKATRRLLDSKQQQQAVLQKTLKLCCEKGLLNQVIVQQVQLTCQSDDEWEQVGGELSNYIGRNDLLQIGRVPKSWTCNARR